MDLKLMCFNPSCKHYFEDLCIVSLNEERHIINEDGKCESYEKGLNEGYEEV